MTADLNHPVPIRAGEELPLDRLADYLRQQWPDAAGTLTVEQFPHGHSNLTYLLRCGSRELVLRRPPFGNRVATAHDMGREFWMLSRLHPVFPGAPRPEHFCKDERILGAPFFLMERRRGLILRKTLPAGLTMAPDLARRMSCALIDHLAALHAIDYRAAGLSDAGKPHGYVERQVIGWTRRFSEAQTPGVPGLFRLKQLLRDHMPAEAGAAVIHNDFKYDNLMLDAADLTRIVAVLDWEMATIGDPLMDLGTTLAYWVNASDPPEFQQAAFGPTALQGSLTRQELVQRYWSQTTLKARDVTFYYCFGLFKLAVIVQQIYARYVRGHTTDPRFAQLDQLVSLLSQQAERTLQTGRV